MASLGLPATRALPRINAGVIDDARRYRRRRRLVGAVMAATLATGIVGLQVATSTHGSAVTVAPWTSVLVDQPWIGVACPAPVPFNAARAIAIARACDRVGLAINLRTRAVTATATISGQSFKLGSAAWSAPPVGGKHESLSGFLQHARFLHGPFKTVTFRNGVRQRFTVENVRLVIDYGAGRKVQTFLHELGYGGWG